jgi:hypothetical protein
MKEIFNFILLTILISVLLYSCSTNFRDNVNYLLETSSYAKEYCRVVHNVNKSKIDDGVISTDKNKPFGWCELPNGYLVEIDELNPEFLIHDNVNVTDNHYPRGE